MAAAPLASTLRHVRAPVPLVFRESAKMPTGKLHYVLCKILFDLLRHELGPAHSVGCDQFVYWESTDPRRCRGPDIFVKLGVPDTMFKVWKCWERGAPDLAVEVVSDFDADPATWEERFDDYTRMGVAELVRFDPQAPPGSRLQAWDRLEGDFVERVVEGDETPCVTLGLTWVVRPAEDVEAALRLARPSGELVMSRAEGEASARAAHVAAVEARRVAEARVRELEEALRAKR